MGSQQKKDMKNKILTNEKQILQRIQLSHNLQGRNSKINKTPTQGKIINTTQEEIKNIPESVVAADE